jgi:hypothetical protein
MAHKISGYRIFHAGSHFEYEITLMILQAQCGHGFLSIVGQIIEKD